MKRLSYLSSIASKPLLGETIGNMLTRVTTSFPQNPAIISCHQKNQMLTYEQLNQKVTSVSKGLIGLGLNSGDRVGIYSPNCIEWTIVQLAASRSGLILVNINPAYMKDELQYALNKVQCKALVMATSDAKSNYLDILEGIDQKFGSKNNDKHDLKLKKLPHLKNVVLLPNDTMNPGAKEIEHAPQYFKFQQLTQIGESSRKYYKELEDRTEKMQFDEATNIQFTSGTTGFPKGATLSHHNILNNGYMVGERLHFTQKDKICLPVPYYHCFGMVLGNLAVFTYGSSVVLPSPSFSPVPTLQAIHNHRCTTLYGVPTMFVSILAANQKGNYNTKSLRTGVMAGSICPQPLMRRVIDQLNMKQVTVCYGLTETSPVSFQSRIDSPVSKRVSTVGQLHPHIEAKVIDRDTGKMVQIGQRGQLCIRGYSIMMKYWDDEKATKKSIDDEGWIHCGDIATIDQEGYGNIYGRYGDMIIRGGENVYPKEIEELIVAHPDVQDVQVVGVKDDYYGEEICAWVSLKDGVKERIEKENGGDLQNGARKLILDDYCVGKISKFKIPRILRVVDTFPMTITGKIKKNVMRDVENERASKKKKTQ